ncbi:MAG: hypothetical protein MZV70_14265 [Desulfobacterales bacterium]|nr:hypothetical protein [Desulfobacterales bacterium]
MEPRLADGQTVDWDKPFVLNDGKTKGAQVELMYPGDPKAPPGRRSTACCLTPRSADAGAPEPVAEDVAAELGGAVPEDSGDAPEDSGDAPENSGRAQEGAGDGPRGRGMRARLGVHRHRPTAATTRAFGARDGCTARAAARMGTRDLRALLLDLGGEAGRKAEANRPDGGLPARLRRLRRLRRTHGTDYCALGGGRTRMADRGGPGAAGRPQLRPRARRQSTKQRPGSADGLAGATGITRASARRIAGGSAHT